MKLASESREKAGLVKVLWAKWDGELEAEIAALVGLNRTAPGDLDAQIAAYGRVRRTYTAAAAPLYEIEKQVGAILRDALGRLAGGERGWGDTLRGVRDQRAGDPEVRARSLERRGLRPEFSGAKRG